MIGTKTLRTPMIMLATTCCLTGAAFAVSGNARSLIKMAPTGVWFANQSGGSVSHVGPAGADATVALDGGGGDLRITQLDGVAFVIDAQGRASRIDPAQLTVSQQAMLPSKSAQLVAGGGHLYAVDTATGTIREIDPVSMTAISQAVVVGKQLGAAVVDSDGKLWVADKATGALVEVAGGTVRSTQQVSQPGAEVRLAVVGADVVAINPSTSTVTVVGGTSDHVGSSNVVAVEPGGTFATPDHVGDGSVLPLLSNTVLTTVDLTSGQSQRTDLVVPGHNLGTPQVAAGKIYVPDYTNGTLLVVDITTGAIVNTIKVTGKPGTFEVAVDSGRVFVNDPDSERAWTLDASGNLIPVVKYDPNRPGNSGATTPPTIPPAPKIPPKQPTPPTPPATPPADPKPTGKKPPTEATQPPAQPDRRTQPAPADPITPTVEIPVPASPTDDANANGRGRTNDPSTLPGRGTPPSDITTTTTPTPPDSPPPSLGDGAIDAVMATSGDATASVTWQAPTGWRKVTGFEIVLQPAGVTYQADATATSYTVAKLVNGAQYTFVVTALSDRQRGASVTSNVTSPAAVAPGAPTNISVTPGDAQVQISWTAPTGVAADGYSIDLIPDAGGTTINKTVVGATTSTVVSGLGNSTAYHAVVRATLTSGVAGPPATSQTFIPRGRPGPPGSVTAAVSGPGQIAVSWTASSDNGSAVSRYSISAPGVTAQTMPSPVATPPGTVLTADFASLIIGASYTFTVTATNAAGTSDAVAPAVVVQSQVPDAPSNVTASAGDGAATLTWTAPNGNGTTIASYIIRNRTDGTTQSTTATNYVYQPLVNGVAVSFDVQAVGTNGSTSPAGAAGPATVTPVGAPSQPTGLTVGATSPTSATVTFSQQSPSNGTTVGQVAISTVPATTTVNATSGSATLTGLTPGTNYTVNVVAVGTNGFNSAPASATVSTPTGLPGAVTGVTMSGTTSRRLSWGAAPGADGYIIDPGTGLAPITVMAPGLTTSWRVGYAGDLYTATVTPFNAYGNGPTESWDYAVPCAPRGQICP